MKVFLDASNRVVCTETAGNPAVDLAYIQANRPERNATQMISNAPEGLQVYEPHIMRVCNLNKAYHEKTSGDGTDISHYTQQEDLRCAKLDAEKIVDSKTYTLIRGPFELGFQWNSHYFSMSSWGQLNLIGGTLFAAQLSYPLGWSAHDLNGNFVTYSIADAAELQNIYATGLGRKKVIMESGRAINVAIEAAVDQAGIDAALATDNRDYEDYP